MPLHTGGGPRARAVAAFFAAAVLATPCSAAARTQNSVSTQLGVVGIGSEDRLWQRTRFDVGVKLESLWFRESPRSFGIGPFAEVRTPWFLHADYGGGVLALLPVDPTFPVWLGGGAFARRGGGAWAPGANAFIAWGGRSFNYHASYAMAYGVMFDVRWHGGEQSGVDAVIAATLDLEVFAFPFLYAVSALRSEGPRARASH